jgi:hypothetical protein
MWRPIHAVTTERVIHLHPLAPPKPPPGAACNGCGVCCAAEPCPLGLALTRRRRGACAALRWDDAQARYRCGVLADTGATLRMPRWAAPAARALAARWIAAGAGCDSDLVPQPPR